ncbi:MAG: tetratricopeptide repeat protein [Candidatus Omnitrophota bacterium]|nr:tetratricopeptide repeat protein [Candidatus Omnitrophota bacterium]
MKRIIFLLTITALAVYFNTLNHSFVWDDHFLIEENNAIKDIKYIPEIFSTDLYHSYAKNKAVEHSNFYRPIQSLSFLADYHIWKLNPFGFHLSNILLHLANGILVFIAVFVICKSMIVSLFTSVLFLVHPVQTGAVAYIAGRSDLLACFFLLISFILYAGRPSFFKEKEHFFRIGSLSAFVFALLSKEVAVIFPLILIFYDIAYKRNISFRMSAFLKKYSTYLFVDAAYIFLRLSIFNFTPEKNIFRGAAGISSQLLTMSRTFMEYIGLLIFPAGMHMERDVRIAVTALRGDIALSLAGLLALIFLAFISYRRSRSLFFGTAWFVIFLAPFSNIVPINALMAEHWLYIPSIGFFLITGIVLVKLRFTKVNYNFVLTLFILLTLFYSRAAILRNRDWKDDMSIYSATLRLSPKKGKMYYNIGNVYNSKGLFKDAVKYYNLAVNTGMKKTELYTNLAIVYTRLGCFREAEENFREAIELGPDNPFAHNGIGGLFEKMGLTNKAISEYKRAIESHPDFYDAYLNLGVIYGEKGDLKESTLYLERAFSIRKDAASYYNLGYAYYKAGNVDRAEALWRKSLVKYPYNNPAEEFLKSAR